MIYVLDTSVILSDPNALERLKNKHIVIPLAVLNELEVKRTHPELGFAARNALRTLEKYRKSGFILDKVQTSPNGSIRVEINNISDSTLPEPFKEPTNDHKILAVASNLAKTEDVTLLTKDLPLRLKASVAGIKAEDFISDRLYDDWSGILTLEIDSETLSDLYEFDTISLRQIGPADFPTNTGLVLRSPDGSALARRIGNMIVRIKDRPVFGVKGRSAEQRIALDMLTDPNVGIVSMGGPAGTGKSILAIAAGLEQVIEKKLYRKVSVFRPLYAVGGQELGYLPGTAEEKMAPWAAAVFDALEVFCGQNVIDHIIEENLLEVLPLTHIRGRTLTDTFVIVDEAQNLEKMVLLTALTRLGKNSKVALTHDVAQRDNLRVGRHDGISSVVGALTGEPLFGHISLTRSERSDVAELVSRLLES
jgi:PhoH-like ATPase